MLPAALTAKAIQLCAAMLGATQPLPVPSFPIAVTRGAALVGAPRSLADAEATVRDLLALGADFIAGPLAINGRDFATFGITPSTVFDPCGIARIGDASSSAPIEAAATVSSVTALLRRAFGARITDAIRPANASYGALYSWHKVGQAIDFVPTGGVGAIDRNQIRTLMAKNGVRLIELLGPGDRGHSTHWHIAFARPGQVTDRTRPIEGAEDWIVNIADANALDDRHGSDGLAAPASVVAGGAKPPPQWDVFATAEWRSSKGGGS